MENNKRNALAELAEELSWIEDILRVEGHVSYCDDANMAQRILAELAKVQEMERMLSKDDKDLPVNVEMGIIHSYQTNCINKCRAIAEEGESNGK